MRRSAIVVVVSGALIVTLSMGIRQSFGLFLRPISMDLGTGREVFAFAIALQNLLFGLVQPFVGMLADHVGAGRIVLGGTVLYVLGLVLAALSTDSTGLFITLGLLVGLALSGTTFVVVLGAVGRAVPPERRSLAFGITTAGGSLGQFLVVPGAQGLLSGFGWPTALLILAVAAGTMGVLALGVAGKPDHGGAGGAIRHGTLRGALTTAARHRGYWLLNAGFFVCGFHIAFIATHLPAFLTDRALPIETGAMALALIGLFNIAGSYLFGLWGGRHRKKYLLSALYLLRAVIIGVFLSVPVSTTSALLFASAIGFLWLGTVPLTSGLVAQIFGIRYLSTLYGIVFLSHQLGSFLGAWLGGYVYDITGSYELTWQLSIALGVLAAALHWPIRDQAVDMAPRPALAAAEGSGR